MGPIEEDRTRIQLHSTEVQVAIVSLRRRRLLAGRAAGAEPDDRYSPASGGVQQHFGAASPGTSTGLSRATVMDASA